MPSIRNIVAIIWKKAGFRRWLLLVIGSFMLTLIMISLRSTITRTRPAGNYRQFLDNYPRSNPCLSNNSIMHDNIGGRCIRTFKKFRGLLTEDCDGRLGNQMFGYATLYTVSFYNRRRGYMSPLLSGFITKYFKASLDTLDASLYNSIRWYDILQVGRNYRHYSSRRNFKLCGHRPQLWQRYEEIKPKIIKEFTWHNEIEEMATRKITKATELVNDDGISNVTLVGVHVRRSDYVTLVNVALLPPANYYKSAMEYFQSKYPNVIFIIASEDIPWCTHNFANFSTNMNIYYLNGTTEEDGGWDMAVLSKCDHVIFSVGTFGWWSGYLSQGEVIYCSDCYVGGEGWHEYYVSDYATFVLPSWTGMLRNGTLYSLRNSSNTI